MIKRIKAFIQQRFKILNLRETHNKKLGRLGENLAAKYLEKQGYTLVARNVFLQLGRNSIGVVKKSEIDIIAFDKKTLVFVEVKTRSSTMLATPETAVTLAKQKKLIKAARKYKRLIGPTTTHRFDVVSIVWSENLSHTIHLYKDFFQE